MHFISQGFTSFSSLNYSAKEKAKEDISIILLPLAKIFCKIVATYCTIYQSGGDSNFIIS